MGDKVVIGNFNGNFGYVLGRFGDFKKVIYYFNLCFEIFKEVENKVGEVIVYGNFGFCFEVFGKFEDVIYYIEL